MVTALISRQEFEGMRSEQFVDETFKGSLPAFLTAFNSRKKLSDADIDEIQKLIDSMRG
jgi:predicted transcriptional regulator